MATNDTAQDTTKAEADKLKKLADAFEKDETMDPAYTYRWVTTGGKTILTVKPKRA